MKNKRLLSLLFGIFLLSLPVLAVFDGKNIGNTLSILRLELQRDYLKISATQEDLRESYEGQHQKMVDIIKDCNELSLMLYSQKQDYTFDLSYALERVSNEYKAFNEDRMPYDRIVSSLDLEIDRYARLIEALRRLPPERKEVEIVPDSLAYHNDTLDFHLQMNEGALQRDLEKEVLELTDTTEENTPFILDEAGEIDRDSCLFYASELLMLYARTKEVVVADSIHYREAYLRLKESYDYANEYYKLLQKNVFIVGQTPWFEILSHPSEYWNDAKGQARAKYLDYLISEEAQNDIETDKDAVIKSQRLNYSLQFFYLFFFAVGLLLYWAVARLVIGLVFRFVKPLKGKMSKIRKRYFSLLLAILMFVLFSNASVQDPDLYSKAIKLATTFMWLFAAIIAALLIRLKDDKLRNGLKLYLTNIFSAFFVIGCRVVFMPNALMNYIFPPLLIVLTVMQLITCLRRSRNAERIDAVIGWAALGVTFIALVASCVGYIFISLLILVWWYFQMAAVLTAVTVWHMLKNYRDKRMAERVKKYRKQIDFVTGPDKEKLMFGATWFYDLVKSVLIPLLVITSIPFCLHLSLDVFEFEDIYNSFFNGYFVHMTNADGEDAFRISVKSIILVAGLFFIFRYLNQALHVIWQSARYRAFMRKYNRKSIRNNEINLSLGNSIISVLLWFLYIVIVVTTFQIPTGSLSLAIGGLSAGIGLALKDILNNFIYGIQLMGGRLRVGDWIECDGVRGKVSDINYQSTLVETIEGTQVAFLNASLFGKNFNNLTRNNSYEFTKIIVGVAYGSDVEKVREVLVNAMQVMRTKDAFGREIVDPQKGVYVVVDEMADSAVNIAVKQYVLVAERIAYVDKAKEVIYSALNEAGIVIAFPQCDIHLIKE